MLEAARTPDADAIASGLALGDQNDPPVWLSLLDEHGTGAARPRPQGPRSRVHLRSQRGSQRGAGTQRPGSRADHRSRRHGGHRLSRHSRVSRGALPGASLVPPGARPPRRNEGLPSIGSTAYGRCLPTPSRPSSVPTAPTRQRSKPGNSRCARSLRTFDDMLAGRDYLMGEGFSAADCVAWPFLRYALIPPDEEDTYLFHAILVANMPLGDRYERLSGLDPARRRTSHDPGHRAADGGEAMKTRSAGRDAVGRARRRHHPRARPRRRP